MQALTPQLPFLALALTLAGACVDADDDTPCAPSAPTTATAADDPDAPRCGAPDPAEARAPAATFPAGDELADDRLGHPPRPEGDTVATREDEAVRVDLTTLLANDRDPDGDRLAVVGVVAGPHVTVSVAGHALDIVPDRDFHGTATFDYVVSDGRMHATARVAVEVTPVADAPIAGGGRIELAPGQHAVFVLKMHDGDGDALTAKILELPSAGTLRVTDGKYEYVPLPGWPGVDRLVYRATDGILWSAPATITFVAAPDA